ncbi:MAG: hypothetical protein UV51_C0007G0018 [Candidatus Woesebacteria bacterium GW2011_GWC1_42_9]|nr:MAG: hypothetical protein UV51_C0007G0018 [Candidatus Woesebacteria bacterium GW2011_GWC1_42_9]
MDFHQPNKTILEIGCSDYPALFYCDSYKNGYIIEPQQNDILKTLCATQGIVILPGVAEDVPFPEVDEVWIFNLLQHVMDPALIISKSKAASRIIRFFEPINCKPLDIGHLHDFDLDYFNSSFSGCAKHYPSNPNAEKFHAHECAYGVWEKHDGTAEGAYLLNCSRQSDINEHLPVLRKYAERCKHITEMGFRWGCSIYAFMVARPERLISYDIKNDLNVADVEAIAAKEGVSFQFINKDVLDVVIEETDLLFIDTFHSANQLSRELALHSCRVRKYLIFHDTAGFWEDGMDAKGNGIRYAIEPFMAAHHEWKQVYRAENNGGLLILEKNA